MAVKVHAVTGETTVEVTYDGEDLKYSVDGQYLNVWRGDAQVATFPPGRWARAENTTEGST